MRIAAHGAYLSSSSFPVFRFTQPSPKGVAFSLPGQDSLAFSRKELPQIRFTRQEAQHLLHLLLPTATIRKVSKSNICNLGQLASKVQYLLQDCATKGYPRLPAGEQSTFVRNGDRIRSLLTEPVSDIEGRNRRLEKLFELIPFVVMQNIFQCLREEKSHPGLAWQMIDTLADYGLPKLTQTIMKNNTAWNLPTLPQLSPTEIVEGGRIIYGTLIYPWAYAKDEAGYLLLAARTFQPTISSKAWETFLSSKPELSSQLSRLHLLQQASNKHRKRAPQFRNPEDTAFKPGEISPEAHPDQHFIQPEHYRDWLRLFLANRMLVSRGTIQYKTPQPPLPKKPDPGRFDVV